MSKTSRDGLHEALTSAGEMGFGTCKQSKSYSVKLIINTFIFSLYLLFEICEDCVGVKAAGSFSTGVEGECLGGFASAGSISISIDLCPNQYVDTL